MTGMTSLLYLCITTSTERGNNVCFYKHDATFMYSVFIFIKITT